MVALHEFAAMVADDDDMDCEEVGEGGGGGIAATIVEAARKSFARRMGAAETAD
jgi:hypothetical protein